MPRTHTKSSTTRVSIPKTPPQWNLTDLLSHPQKDFNRILATLNKQLTRLEASRKTLTSSISSKKFLACLKVLDSITTDTSRLYAFAQLWFAQNTTNQSARAFESQVQERLAAIGNRLLFFDLWWQSLDKQAVQRLQKHSGDYHYHLDTIWRLKDHTLSEPEERILNLKNNTGRNALDSIYNIHTNGFTYNLRLKNKTSKVSREELSAHFRNSSARTRQEAYTELYRVYEGNRDILGEIYKSLVLDWKIEGIDLRKYSSPISVRNVANDIPDQAVSALLKTCRKNAGIFQEYFRLKARICGIKPFSRFHLYAPTKLPSSKFPFPQAVKTVLESYDQFSPTLGNHARRVFQDNHIDAKVRPGKMGGAFCYSVTPTLTPYVLLNYTGETRDVATLAHELGHAVHAMMAQDHTVFTFHSTLPLAETASVFGEQLLSDALLQQESRPLVRQSLLMAQLDDIYATVLRQAYFVEFENQAHAMIAKGATVNDLASTYLGLLREQFGRAVQVPEMFQWEWLSIPHIYRSPFYCYAYSFGNLLVLALFQQYKKRGTPFIPQYLNLLATGGSEAPEAMLKKVGVNIRSERFWQAGFNRIHTMVENLEKTIR